MTYHDYYLKFESEQQGVQMLFDGAERIPKYHAIDIIGVIWKPTGKTVEVEDCDVAEMVPLFGWHANVRHTLPAPELERFSIQPINPTRVWA